jgi:hypothetical protein
VVYAYNLATQGDRDQEDRGVKPCLEKNPSQKRAGGVAQGVGYEFKKKKSTIHISYTSKIESSITGLPIQ